MSSTLLARTDIAREPLPFDPQLPQLPQALDSQAMACVFDRLLVPLGRHRVEACEVERIKYRPQRNLRVAYRLRLRDTASGAPLEQRVAGRFCTGGDSRRRYLGISFGELADTPVGIAISHDPGLDLVACWWPQDPKLGRAARLLGDAVTLARHALPEVVAAMTAGSARLQAQRVSEAHVVAENRLCARVDLLIESPIGTPPAWHTVYAKASADRSGDITHGVMLALAQSPAATSGELRIPQAIVWQQAQGLHWQAALPGRMLLDCEPTVTATTAARIGAMLAALHATPVPGVPRCSFDGFRQTIAHVADTLAPMNDRWALMLQATKPGILAGVDRLRGAPNVTLHGDLHPGNLLLDNGRPGLIDFDSVQRGPAVIDIGDWIAETLYRALLNGRPPASVLPACRALVTAYERAALVLIGEPTLAWSVAHSLLVQRAWRCAVNLKAGRSTLVPSLLQLCDGLLRRQALDAGAVA